MQNTTICAGAPAGIRGIVQATVPVSDLQRSAGFYSDLLDLRYVREFGDGTTITGG